MRPPSWVLAPLLLTLALAAPSQEKARPKAPGEPTVATVTSSNGPWTRVTGKVKIINAYTLRFEDGAEADLRFAVDAPELGQKGSIGGQFYPCGREAAEFLATVIGEKPVTVFDDGEAVPGRKRFRGPCFVGETHLQAELVRNGWAVSSHSGMDAWEVIARDGRRGLWRGQFVPPKKWRTGDRLPGEK